MTLAGDGWHPSPGLPRVRSLAAQPYVKLGPSKDSMFSVRADEK